tara:strand:- start:31 stop:906 length:876 start_codon:yes stop_codon:yes gene_type:complete
MKYAFIAQNRQEFPIKLMCNVLDVSRGGYYHYQANGAGETPPELDTLLSLVRELHQASDHSYGSRRMKEALGLLGHPVSRQKARKLMKLAGVSARHRKKFKVTTNSAHDHPVYPDLVKRQFSVAQRDQVYVSDITYIWTQQGWLYLAVVIDLYSRKVVGWSMSSRMKAQLVCDALTMAIWNRRPPAGLIHHSDRGSQYAGKKLRKLLNAHGYRGSMSRKGDCWDNSVAESFFGSLKQERVQWRNYQSRYEAQQDVLNYITMFYNSRRLHSTIGYVSPNEFEKQSMTIKKAA